MLIVAFAFVIADGFLQHFGGLARHVSTTGLIFILLKRTWRRSSSRR
jgi:hypothetical protein